MTTIENLKSDCRPGKLGKVYIVIPVHNRINKTLKSKEKCDFIVLLNNDLFLFM